MSAFARCLNQTAAQVSQLLPEVMRNDAGKPPYLALAGVVLAASCAAAGHGVRAVLDGVAAGAILSGSTTPAGQAVQDVGRVAMEEVGRSMGRKVAQKPFESDPWGQAQQLRDKLDTAALQALLAAADKAEFGPSANYRTPGWDLANQRLSQSRDAFEVLYRGAVYNRQDVQPWQAINTALRSRPENLASHELAALAVEPLNRLNRPGGPGFQRTNSARVTMADIRHAIDAGQSVAPEQAMR